MTRAERLPLEREHPVPLQIAERAVIGQHVEPVAGALERPSGLVTAVGALTDVGLEQRRAIVG